MKLKSALLAIIATASVGFSASAQADTFYLNYSNTVGNIGVDFAKVDVTASSGNLNFSVTSLNPTGWWFDKFYFNLIGDVGTVSLTGLPSGWGADSDQNVSMFGVFTDGATVAGKGASPLNFTVDATADLTLASLGTSSKGWMFAAHQKCGGRNHPECSSMYDGQENPFSSHYIADTPTSIPAPAAAWLLGSALLGFVGYRRRS